jgi:sec-independent protein translocase protein TatC
MNSVPGDEEQPLVEHIKELRSRMIVTAVPIAVITFIAFMFSGELLQIIWKHSLPISMTVYSPLELLITKMSLSLVCSLFIGIPLLLYEAFMFVGKGLYKNEKQFFIKIVPFSFILFLIGSALAYFVAIPIVFKYTILYSTDIATPQVSVINTVSSIITLIVGFGIIFQFPLLLIFALRMRLIKLESLRKQRYIIYGALLTFGLFISPDPTTISALIVAVALVILFEFSLLVARFF